jgi:hypothetical protein
LLFRTVSLKHARPDRALSQITGIGPIPRKEDAILSHSSALLSASTFLFPLFPLSSSDTITTTIRSSCFLFSHASAPNHSCQHHKPTRPRDASPSFSPVASSCCVSINAFTTNNQHLPPVILHRHSTRERVQEVQRASLIIIEVGRHTLPDG